MKGIQLKSSLNAATVLGFFALFFVPIPVFAATFGNFFAPPSTDISISLLQALFGTGSDYYNGWVLRPLMFMLASGVVMFMGAIFAWNLVKLVLHSSQHGEMMLGRGKELGMVLLRSVFGIGVGLPIYSGGYQGLCIAYIFVAWIVTQGIGLADQGVNAVVDYLKAGGTVYQVTNTSSEEDTLAQQGMSDPVLGILSAETCVYSLRIAQANQNALSEQTNSELGDAGVPVSDTTNISTSDIGYGFTRDGSTINFGTRNINYSTQDAASGPPYFSECGSVALPSVSNDPNNQVRYATVQLITALNSIAYSTAKYYPAEQQSLSDRIPVEAGNSILDYSNAMTPLRAEANDSKTQAAYALLDRLRRDGWIALGAYYPLMGRLSIQDKTGLSNYDLTFSEGLLLSSGQVAPNINAAYNTADLTQEQRDAIKTQNTFILEKSQSVKNYIAAINSGDADTIAQQLQQDNNTIGQDSPGIDTNVDYDFGSNPWSGGGFYKTPWSAISQTWNQKEAIAYQGVNFFQNAFSKIPFLNASGAQGGDVLGGALADQRLKGAAALVGIATATGGPLAWATVIPTMVYFVNIMQHFRNAIDQSKNPDPIFALFQFGWFLMNQAVALFFIVMAGTFSISMISAVVPSMNLVQGVTSGLNIESSLIMLFFSGFAAAGIAFGMYVPLIPFFVWISAVLGWVAHSFQAIAGAPLIALKLTVADGEGMLGGAVEGVAIVLGLLFTPFLLVMGLVGTLILLKQVLILVNYLFGTIFYVTFVMTQSPGFFKSIGFLVIGTFGTIFIYYLIVLTSIQYCCSLIAEAPSILRYIHPSMQAPKGAEQMAQKLEQGGEKAGGQTGEYMGKRSSDSGFGGFGRKGKK